MNRSMLLERVGLAAGAIVVASTTVLGARAWEQGVFRGQSGIAYAPWDRWKSYTGPLALVAAAILAANAHDLQPWLFHVDAAGIDLYADFERTLGAADPLGREFDVSLGCALENLMLAAGPNGYRAELHLMPTGAGQSHVARIELAPATPIACDLYDQIPNRHTNRGPFDRSRLLSDAILRGIATHASLLESRSRVVWFSSDTQRKTIGALLVEATQAFIDDDAQSRASFAGLRSNWNEIQKLKDGLTLDTQGLTVSMLAAAEMLPKSTRADGDRFWLASTRDVHTATAMAYGIVVVGDAQDRTQRIGGGRFLQRLHLAAAAAGVAVHHMNQLTERADREASLHETPRFGRALSGLVGEQETALVTFRAGYALRPARLSPRRSVADVRI